MTKINIIYLILLTLQIQAQHIKLDYEPTGQIIKLNLDSLTIYTDTTSVFSIMMEYYEDPNYTARTRNLIINKIKESGHDTIFFTGNNIPFNDTIDNKWQPAWYVYHIIILLIEKNKLKIFDKANRQVNTIKTKRIRKKRKGIFIRAEVSKAYINKDTNEKLFSRSLKVRRITFSPRWN
ncbi:MAG: hypothetical protein FVQ77_13945 [Cytophagales bacterium]|nr:hypothetical protein [Cytophagales bacterium]